MKKRILIFFSLFTCINIQAQNKLIESIKYYENCILSNIKPTTKDKYKFAKHEREIIWEDFSTCEDNYVKKVFEQLGYEFVKDMIDWEKNSHIYYYRKCQDGILLSNYNLIGHYYTQNLIKMSWWDEPEKYYNSSEHNGVSLIKVKKSEEEQKKEETLIVYCGECMNKYLSPYSTIDGFETTAWGNNKREVIWKDELINNQRYTKETLKQIGYEYKFGFEDKTRTSFTSTYRNCDKNIILEVIEWYKVKYYIKLTWWDEPETQLGFKGCPIKKEADLDKMYNGYKKEQEQKNNVSAKNTIEDPVNYFSNCIINEIIPDGAYSHKYEKDMRVIVWNDELLKEYKYSNEMLDKLGYSFVKKSTSDNQKNTLIYRNCKNKTLLEITKWYDVKLSIQISWWQEPLKYCTYLKFCN